MVYLINCLEFPEKHNFKISFVFVVVESIKSKLCNLIFKKKYLNALKLTPYISVTQTNF